MYFRQVVWQVVIKIVIGKRFFFSFCWGKKNLQQKQQLLLLQHLQKSIILLHPPVWLPLLLFSIARFKDSRIQCHCYWFVKILTVMPLWIQELQMSIGHSPLVLACKYFPMYTCTSISNLHEAGHSTTFVLFLDLAPLLALSRKHAAKSHWNEASCSSGSMFVNLKSFHSRVVFIR